MIFGGFHDGSLDKVQYFRVIPGGQGEGEITQSTTTKLGERDFFVTNGICLKVTEKMELLVTGHNHIHAFDIEQRTFKIVPQIQ